MFQWLPDEVQTAFNAASRTRSYRHGERIYTQGEPGERMYRLTSGAIRLSVTRADGRELLYLHFEPGDCFGVSSCVDAGPRPHTAEAAADAQLQILDKAAIDRLRSEHRSFDDALLRVLSGHMRLLSGLFADAHLSELLARVASRIVAAARSFGVATNEGIRLSLRLSQAEIARMVGGSRQSVNKALQQLQDEGILAVTYGNVTILNFQRLVERATDE